MYLYVYLTPHGQIVFYNEKLEETENEFIGQAFVSLITERPIE